MKKNIILKDKNNKEIICDILIEFTFNEENYIVYTDNTFDENNNYNLYKAKIDSQNKLSDPTDVDVEDVFKKLIAEYKAHVIGGEV